MVTREAALSQLSKHIDGISFSDFLVFGKLLNHLPHLFFFYNLTRSGGDIISILIRDKSEKVNFILLIFNGCGINVL